MRPFRIILCCLLTTFLPASLRAQPDPAAPPEAAQTIAAYNAVESWVREWRLEDHKDPPVPACRAASITLRLSGEVVGRGVEVAQSDDDRVGVISAALRAALQDAEPRLGIPRDALYETTRRDLARQLIISVQLAGEFIPIQPGDAAEAMAMVEPGVEGVAARLGNRTSAMFPERMLTMQTEPGPALGTLIGRLASDPTFAVEPLSKLAKDRGAVFYRFRVSHVAQTTPRDTPVFLTRCTKYVPLTQLDDENLRRWAEKLAIHLLERPWREDGKYGMAGTLEPVSGRFESPHASAYEQAIAGYALLNYVRTANESQQWRERIRPELDRWISELALHLAQVETGEEDPASDPAAAALTVRLLDWISVPPTTSTGAARSPNRTPALVDLKKRCIASTQQAINGHSPASDAKLAIALCVGPATAAGIKDNHSALDGIFQRLGTPMLPSAMPWIGWAEQRGGGSAIVQSDVILREMRSLLWQHQLQSSALAIHQHDLAGGILFTASKQPMPTWQSARPLAFTATMLGDPRFTPDKDVPEELSKLLASLRFLRQLTAGEAECFMYKHPDRARGGVRSSLWDQRMPVEATAMTLITVSETIKSLEAIRKRQAEIEAK